MTFCSFYTHFDKRMDPWNICMLVHMYACSVMCVCVCIDICFMDFHCDIQELFVFVFQFKDYFFICTDK